MLSVTPPCKDRITSWLQLINEQQLLTNAIPKNANNEAGPRFKSANNCLQYETNITRVDEYRLRVRERVVSPGAQTRAPNKKLTGGSQALNVHNTD